MRRSIDIVKPRGRKKPSYLSDKRAARREELGRELQREENKLALLVRIGGPLARTTDVGSTIVQYQVNLKNHKNHGETTST